MKFEQGLIDKEANLLVCYSYNTSQYRNVVSLDCPQHFLQCNNLLKIEEEPRPFFMIEDNISFLNVESTTYSTVTEKKGI